ncbi:MAG: carbohydrate ABC transporter permease [Thermomicrobium sp.]|nr:carbohydrate ABC transporter permease [Thermomicrobium sp.]
MLLLCSFLAFLFAKWEFPGRNVLFGLSLATMFIPYQATLVAFYLVIVRLGWLNTFFPLWVPWWVPGFAIFFLRQYIRAAVPDELLDAGLIDGASVFRQYWSIVLPLIVPALVVVGVLNFVNAWNDYIYSNLVFTDMHLYPSTLYLYSFQGSRIAVPEYGMMTAASIVSGLPIITLFLIFQRQIIGGLTRGAIR